MVFTQLFNKQFSPSIDNAAFLASPLNIHQQVAGASGLSSTILIHSFTLTHTHTLWVYVWVQKFSWRISNICRIKICSSWQFGMVDVEQTTSKCLKFMSSQWLQDYYGGKMGAIVSCKQAGYPLLLLRGRGRSTRGLELLWFHLPPLACLMQV